VNEKEALDYFDKNWDKLSKETKEFVVLYKICKEEYAKWGI